MIAQRLGNLSFGWRRAARLLVLVTSLGAATMVVAPPAFAFHESVADAQVNTEGCGGVDKQVIAAQDVKSFNETATSTVEAMDARASQSTSVSSSSTLRVTTSGEMNVTVSEPPGGCGTAGSFMSVFPAEDDSEFTGEYFFTISGSMSFEDESDGGSPAEDGCIQFSVGGSFGESKCQLTEDDSIDVNGSGFDDFPVLNVSASVGVSSTEATSATARWDLTLTVFPADVCPATEPAAAGFSAAAAECPTEPTVGFTNDVGLDGLLTESGSLALLVELSPPQPTEVVVNIRTAEMFGQEAIAGQDYESRQGQVTFPPGEVVALFSVPLIEDVNAEPDEAFVAKLTLSGISATPVTLGKDSAFVIIRDDDCALHVPSASGPNDVTVPAAGVPGAVCGSVFGDVIRGSDTGDLILGGAGDDVLTGRGGQDALAGGVGNDHLFGGFGLDSVIDDPSRDFLTGGPLESRGPDEDEIFGENGNDVIDGGAGNDSLFGGTGNDDIAGGFDVDTVEGGPDNDLLFAADRPTLPLVLNTAAYLTENTNGDILRGGDGNDTLHGSSGDNQLFGGAGSDTIYGHAGRDQLFGEGGADSLLEGPIFSPDLVRDVLNGGNGVGEFDACIATPVIDTKTGCEL